MYQNELYDDAYFQAFGEQLRQAREKAGYEINDLVDLTGFSKNKIFCLEQGISRRLEKSLMEHIYRLCFFMKKKVVLTLEDLPQDTIIEQYDREKVPYLTKEQLLIILGQRL